MLGVAGSVNGNASYSGTTVALIFQRCTMKRGSSRQTGSTPSLFRTYFDNHTFSRHGIRSLMRYLELQRGPGWNLIGREHFQRIPWRPENCGFLWKQTVIISNSHSQSFPMRHTIYGISRYSGDTPKTAQRDRLHSSMISEASSQSRLPFLKPTLMTVQKFEAS